MDLTLIIIVVGLLVILMSGLPVGIALALLGLVCIQFLIGDFKIMAGSQLWRISTTFTLSTIPLYVLMSEILTASGVAGQLYDGVGSLVGRVRGGLEYVNVIACAIFAAVNGSSTATSAAIGKVAWGELEKRGYDPGLSLASLAAAGTLGILIPPSLGMIVYAILAEASIGQLFVAGVIPGILMAIVFCFTIFFVVLRSPEKVPSVNKAEPVKLVPFIRKVGPVALIFIAVIGSMYLGLATPTESAAIGTLMAIILAAVNRTLTWGVMKTSVLSSVRVASMLMLIFIGGSLVSFVLARLHLPTTVLDGVLALNLNGMWMMIMIFVFYTILGCFADPMTIMVVTVPVVIPMVVHYGFDRVWFGVIMMLLIELGNITPPLGLNLFVIQSISGESFGVITKAIMPFVIAIWVMLLVLLFFPDLVLFLPRVMFTPK